MNINYTRLYLSNLIIIGLILLSVTHIRLQASYQLNSTHFIENKGQILDSEDNENNDLLYYSNLGNFSIYIKKNSISYIIRNVEYNTKSKNDISLSDYKATPKVSAERVDLNFIGSNTKSVLAVDEASHYLNFYYPHCPQGINGVRSFKKIVLKNLYDNIDAVFYFSDSKTIKYDFIVYPGANPNNIKISASHRIELNPENGAAIYIKTALGEIAEEIPLSYQFKIASFKSILTNFTLNDNILGFETQYYDKSSILVIDPDVKWATYFGGEDGDHATGITYDNDRRVVVTGYTLSKNFPVSSGAIQKSRAGIYDSFIAKFDDQGNLLWATYFGGEDTDYAEKICHDNINNLYICGYTWSRNFPVSDDAFQRFYAGGLNDGFIASFDKFGNRRWATYYGGSQADHFYGIACNGKDEIAVTGRSESWDMYKSDFGFGKNPLPNDDAFLIRMNLDGSFKWATFWGGNGDDVGRCVAYDKFGHVIFAGYTDSQNFPIVGAVSGDRTRPQLRDVFIAKFNGFEQFTYIYSRIYGGSSREECWTMEIDDNNKIVLAGYTLSSDFPLSNNAIQRSYSGGEDIFVLKLDENARMDWSTYLGGSSDDIATAIAIDQYDCITIAGRTRSDDLRAGTIFPESNLKGLSDIFFIKINGNGTQALWADYYGGTNHEWVWDIAAERSGMFYICGATESIDFPITANPQQEQNKGGADAIIAKICGSLPKPEIEIIGNTEFCSGDSVILRVNPPFDRYYWSTNERTRSIIVRKSGLYSVEVMDSLGCMGKSQSVEIFVIEPEPPEITGQLGFCEGDSTYIEVAGSYLEYNWSNGAKTKGITVKQPGTYTVSVRDTTGCKAENKVQIVRYRNPQPVVKGPATVCAFSQDIMYRITADPTEYYIWCTEGGDMIYGVDSINIVVDWGTGGRGKVAVKAVNRFTGCYGEDTLYIKISDKLEPEIESSSGIFEFCIGDSIRLNAGSEYPHHFWSTGETDPEITIKTPGRYFVTVKDDYDCEGTDTIDVIMHPLPEPKISGLFEVCAYSDGIMYETPDISGHSYTWSVEGGIINGNANDYKVNVDWGNNASGIIRLNERNEITGCENISEITVIIYPLPEPTVSASQTAICIGDSALLSLDRAYSSYEWSNGSSWEQIWVKSQGYYYAKVSDENGCYAISDSVYINVNPKPNKPTIARKLDTLYSSKAEEYRWYHNETELSGENDSTLIALESGDYRVRVKNIYDCWEISDPFPFKRGFAKIAIVPDTIFEPTGKIIKIPLEIIESNYLRAAGADKFQVQISFNGTILLPDRNYSVISSDMANKAIRIEGSLKDTMGSLISLEFHTALGEVVCTEITLDSLLWIDAPVDNLLSNAYLCLTDICYIGEVARLVRLEGSLNLSQNAPNPFSESTEIIFETIEIGLTRIDLIDVMGRKIRELFNSVISPGVYIISFNAGDLPSGVYFYILQTPNGSMTKKLEIVR